MKKFNFLIEIWLVIIIYLIIMVGFSFHQERICLEHGYSNAYVALDTKTYCYNIVKSEYVPIDEVLEQK